MKRAPNVEEVGHILHVNQVKREIVRVCATSRNEYARKYDKRETQLTMKYVHCNLYRSFLIVGDFKVADELVKELSESERKIHGSNEVVWMMMCM